MENGCHFLQEALTPSMPTLVFSQESKTLDSIHEEGHSQTETIKVKGTENDAETGIDKPQCLRSKEST